MKKLKYFIASAFIASLLLTLALFNSNSEAKGKEKILKINKEIICYDEVIENMESEYWDESINSIINSKLLYLAAEKYNISTSKIDLENFKKKSPFMKNSKIHIMSKEKQEKYLKEMYLINEIAKNKTLNGSTSLGLFIEANSETKPQFSKKTHTVQYLESNDEKQIKKVASLLKKGESIEEIEEKLKVEFGKKQFSMFNSEGIPLETMKIKDIIQNDGHTTHNGEVQEEAKILEESDDHQGHEIVDDEDHISYTIFIVTDIDKKNLPTESEISDMKQLYLNSSILLEKEYVFNFLREQFTIEYY